MFRVQCWLVFGVVLGMHGHSRTGFCRRWTETGSPSDAYDSSEMGGHSDTSVPQSTLEQSGIVRCEDPSLRESLGPFALTELGPGWLTQTGDDEAAESFEYGYGLAVGDLDADGWPDIVLAHLTRPQLWMGSAEGQWSEESTDRIRIPDELLVGDAWSSTLPSLADMDGDGDLDLYLAMESISDQIYLNDGTGHFENWTTASGLPSSIEGVRGLAWGDLDGDLDLDLMVGANGLEEGDYGDPNYVLFNDGSGRFEDRSEQLTEEERMGYTQVVGILILMETTPKTSTSSTTARNMSATACSSMGAMDSSQPTPILAPIWTCRAWVWALDTSTKMRCRISSWPTVLDSNS